MTHDTCLSQTVDNKTTGSIVLLTSGRRDSGRSKWGWLVLAGPASRGSSLLDRASWRKSCWLVLAPPESRLGQLEEVYQKKKIQKMC